MTLTVQLQTMAAMIAAGIGFGMMLDTYQRFLNRPKRKSWIAFINDILFWSIQALLIFYVLFLVNHGELRFYIFLAILCGFAAYQALFRKMFLRLLEGVIALAVKLSRFCAKTATLLVFKPIAALIHLLIGLLLLLGKAILGAARILLKVLKGMAGFLILAPVKKIMVLFWKLLPKGIKKRVEKLYNGMAGISAKIKNAYRRVKQWLKRKK